jgi:hypothetical protein
MRSYFRKRFELFAILCKIDKTSRSRGCPFTTIDWHVKSATSHVKKRVKQAALYFIPEPYTNS